MLASIQKVQSRVPHPNADRLDILTVLGYEVIVSKDSELQPGLSCVFIRPDSCLPADADWAATYLPHCGKNGRVRAIRLRGSWSVGIVMDFHQFDYETRLVLWEEMRGEGQDLTAILGVTKYEPPQSGDPGQQKGSLPIFVKKTDQVNWNEVYEKFLGREVEVTRKRDGSSITLYVIKGAVGIANGAGVCSRNLELKIFDDVGALIDNQWTRGLAATSALGKLCQYCEEQNESFVLQGELFGHGIQKDQGNPDNKQPVTVEFFHAYRLPQMPIHHGTKLTRHHPDREDLQKLLPWTPVLFRGVLTKELIDHYYTSKLGFEGVVVEDIETGESFKIRNVIYDSKK